MRITTLDPYLVSEDEIEVSQSTKTSVAIIFLIGAAYVFYGIALATGLADQSNKNQVSDILFGVSVGSILCLLLWWLNLHSKRSRLKEKLRRQEQYIEKLLSDATKLTDDRLAKPEK